MGLFNFVQNYLLSREGSTEYKERLKLFLKDSKLTPEEKTELDEISKKYKLTDKDLKKLHSQGLSEQFQSISEDQRITEDERKSLESLANYFGISTDEFEFNQKTFNRLYSLALIDKGILPEIKEHGLNILFKTGEVVYYRDAGLLRKIKKALNKIQYKGLTGSINIGLGLRYRVGSLDFGMKFKEYLDIEDEGIFWLTNERVGFIGKRKNFTLPYGKILSIEVTTDAIYIFKEGKETPYIVTLEDYDVPCSIISFILNK